MSVRRSARPKLREMPLIASDGYSWALIILCTILIALGGFASWAGVLLIMAGGIWGGVGACLLGLTLIISSLISVVEGKPEYVLLNLILP